MKKTHSGRQRGFTMIEIVMVLLIIVILAAVALVKAPSTAQNALKSNAEKLKVQLRYAQLRSLNSSGRVWGIDFSGSTNSYRLYYCLESDPGTAHYVVFPGEDTVIVALDNTTISLDGNRLVSFDTWGKPYLNLEANYGAPSSPQNVDWRTLSLAASGYTESITIRKNTGYIP